MITSKQLSIYEQITRTNNSDKVVAKCTALHGLISAQFVLRLKQHFYFRKKTIIHNIITRVS